MYMMTKGKSNIPLIKLSEGFSMEHIKTEYVTLVCGSNGEPLSPVRIWNSNKLFDFFKKEYLNAEFISKTELVYLKVTKSKQTLTFDLTKYKIPEFMQNNVELEYEAIRSTKPETEQLIRIVMPIEYMEQDETTLHNFFCAFLDGKFTNVFLSAIKKFKSKETLLYYLK